MESRKIGVLVMSYGTPESLDQIEAYYTHIRRGHPPTAEQLRALINRYEAIVGGFFPLRENTNEQVRALEKRLNAQTNETTYVCCQGLKHASPFIEDGVGRLAEQGIKEAVGIVLAPHYSMMSVGSYIKRAQAKADEVGIKINFVKHYHLAPKLIEAFSMRVNKALQKFSGVPQNDIRVIFSAHSLPQKILELKDPYPEQLLETAKAVAEKAGIANWQFAWQSAGRTAEPWLGPDILSVLRNIRNEEQVKHVLMCPVGFVSDHLEILYDIDIECQHLAQELGIQLERIESLNSHPEFIEVLADAIRENEPAWK